MKIYVVQYRKFMSAEHLFFSTREKAKEYVCANLKRLNYETVSIVERKLDDHCYAKDVTNDEEE